MKRLDGRIHECFRKVATRNTEDWFQYVDGYNSKNGDQDMDEELIFKLYLGERGFEGCRRSDFLEELVKLIPAEHVRFNRCLASIEEPSGNKAQLRFTDGSTEEADVVVGCDGIKSRLRQLMLGDDHPACQPSYSHKFAFRGLIPMDKARALLGDYKTSTRFMHLGRDAHALTFPVAGGALLNVVAFVTDPNPWTEPDGKLTAPATKAEAMKAFAGFGPAVRAIMSLLPEELDKWAVFDTYDAPVPRYTRGRLCLAGDAAHAAAPHHGAGAGFGVEDALALAELLAAVDQRLDESVDDDRRDTIIVRAFDAYNEERYERTQWLVDSSRRVGDLYEWRDPDCGSDADKFGPELQWRCRKIWDFDVDQMVSRALKRWSEYIAVNNFRLDTATARG
jgi:salicylate hydroxylase